MDVLQQQGRLHPVTPIVAGVPLGQLLNHGVGADLHQGFLGFVAQPIARFFESIYQIRNGRFQPQLPRQSNQQTLPPLVVSILFVRQDRQHLVSKLVRVAAHGCDEGVSVLEVFGGNGCRIILRIAAVGQLSPQGIRLKRIDVDAVGNDRFGGFIQFPIAWMVASCCFSTAGSA